MTSSSTPVSPAPIGEGWTLADTRAMLEHSRRAPDFSVPSTDPKADQQWREQYHEHLAALSLAIGRHVLHLAQTQGLVNPPHSEAVDNRFINAWRQAQSGEMVSSRVAMAIGDALTRPITLKLVSVKPKFAPEGKQAPTAEDVHAYINERVTAGNFENYETEFGGECQNSGLHPNLTLKQWVPTLKRFDHSNHQSYTLAAGDITGPSLQHATIPVPSGELLIADWFRHDAFNALADKVLEGSPSINSASGCEERTRRLAEGLGIATVFVGNTCPSILADASGVRIGLLTEEGEDAGVAQGSVCTDMWWATMIDKQTLVDLFSRTMSPEQAQEEVAAIIADRFSGITQVSVPPGEYHLYYAGDADLFVKLFDRQGVDFSAFDEPMLVLSATDLEPRPSRAQPKI